MRKARSVSEETYTAEQAAKALGMTVGTFYRQCKGNNPEFTINVTQYKTGSGRERLYDKGAIDALAKSRSLNAPFQFKCVDNDLELRGIVDLCVPIFGKGGTPTFKQRQECWKENPYMYYVLIQEGIVVGYCTMSCLSQDLLDKFMKPAKESREEIYRTNQIRGTNIPFTEGQPIPHLFIAVAVKHSSEIGEDKRRGRRLLVELIRVLCDFKKRGMPIGMIYACSETNDGISIARTLGMKEIVYEGEKKMRYELDPEQSKCKALKLYRELSFGGLKR